ncbi:unnamed protein product [Ambrosiozyma monospora]|uniref:Unnamed protein product n=1 Tax=Ambrosiozyma monospora TaxID=43982 RepID=A0A9W6YS11_AMBMO|nr:unnamed protein product [Ambrosiozyma monospora]
MSVNPLDILRLTPLTEDDKVVSLGFHSSDHPIPPISERQRMFKLLMHEFSSEIVEIVFAYAMNNAITIDNVSRFEPMIKSLSRMYKLQVSVLSFRSDFNFNGAQASELDVDLVFVGGNDDHGRDIMCDDGVATIMEGKTGCGIVILKNIHSSKMTSKPVLGQDNMPFSFIRYRAFAQARSRANAIRRQQQLIESLRGGSFTPAIDDLHNFDEANEFLEQYKTLFESLNIYSLTVDHAGISKIYDQNMGYLFDKTDYVSVHNPIFPLFQDSFKPHINCITITDQRDMNYLREKTEVSITGMFNLRKIIIGNGLLQFDSTSADTFNHIYSFCSKVGCIVEWHVGSVHQSSVDEFTSFMKFSTIPNIVLCVDFVSFTSWPPDNQDYYFTAYENNLKSPDFKKFTETSYSQGILTKNLFKRHKILQASIFQYDTFVVTKKKQKITVGDHIMRDFMPFESLSLFRSKSDEISLLNNRAISVPFQQNPHIQQFM